MNEDFRDLLRALLEAGARFLVVGAHAVAVHGVPRATGDLDVWIAVDPENADRVMQALAGFGAALVANKRASGRAKDRADLEALGEGWAAAGCNLISTACVRDATRKTIRA